MPKNLKVIVSLALSAAALAGCSAADDTGKDEAAQDHVQQLETEAQIMEQHGTGEMETVSEETPPSPSSQASLDGVAFENDWAEQQLRDFMTYQGANSLEAFYEDLPERHITAVTNPQDGVLRFEVKDRKYGKALEVEEIVTFEALASNFMSYTGCAAEGLDKVIVETTGGHLEASADGCG